MQTSSPLQKPTLYNVIQSRRSAAVIVLALLSLKPLQSQSAAGAAKPAPANQSCLVDKAPTSDAEKALSAGNTAKAMDLFATMTDTDASKGKAGIIRTFLAQWKTGEALQKATEWATAEPANKMAVATLAEVYFRRSDFPNMTQTMLAVQKLDPCNARMFLIASLFQHLQGNLDTAKKRLDAAHRLAPNDPEITSLWVQSIGPTQNQAAKHECEPVVPITTAQVPMKEIIDQTGRRTGMGLDVLLNGKLQRMEVDTGASGLVLSLGAAESLGLVREAKSKTAGVGDDGEVVASASHVESVKIAGMEFRNCPVEFLEKQSRLNDVDGLIGGDFFRNYLLTLNFPDLKLRHDPLPPLPASISSDAVPHDRYIAPEMKNWTPILSAGHDLLIPVVLSSKKYGSKDKLFFIDSGAGVMSISPESAREFTDVSGDERVEVYGIGGKVEKMFSTGNFDMTFGHLKQPVKGMTAFDTSLVSRSAGVEVAGFLGEPILLRLTLRIDYRDRLVQFVYDPRNDPINRVNSRY